MFTYEQIRQMNDLEIMIYNYVVSHGEEVAGMTIRELAQQLHVSATTILRFCGKVGCEGYSEFKYRLRAFLKEKQAKELCAKLRFASAPAGKIFHGSDVFRRSHFLRICLPPQKEVFSPEKWAN